MKKKLVGLLAVLLSFAMIAAACGDDDSDSSSDASSSEASSSEASSSEASSSEEDDHSDDDDHDHSDEDDHDHDDEEASETAADPVAEGLARAQAVVDSFSEPPDQITVTESINSAVPEGKTVAWLACEVTCAAFNPAFEAATASLNWDLEIINISSFDANSSILTALDLGADFIAITGTPPATFADELELMVDQGVGMYSCFDTTLPNELEGLMTNCSGNDNVYAAGSVHANNVIVRSGGTAKVLMVNIPDFAVLVSQRNGAAAAFEENCPNCTFEELAVSLDQLLTGEVPGAIISAFQADPDLDWLMVAFDGMLYGILDALEGAGLDERISVSLTDHDAASLQECVDGRIEFGTVNPVLYTAWLMVDGMVRTAVGQDIPGNGHVTPPIPLFLTQTPESCQALLDTPEADWKGPATMEAQFAALWGVN